ncbi:MAG: DUF3135 domain-containing protein [Sedimenticola sp.]|nr:DUF3135 domain-containing protein [Sedimenticola sp.]
MGRPRFDLDFDHWLDLANRDLSAFELQRRRMIDQVIAAAPPPQQERLRKLQWRIDKERERSDSPMGACIRISRMMWERMMGRGGLVEHLERLRQVTSGKKVAVTGRNVTPLLSDRDPG